MKSPNEGIDWSDFLGRPPVGADPAATKALCSDRSVLITGAGGSIGSGLARAIAVARPRKLMLLDLSESGLFEVHRQIVGLAGAEGVALTPILGSVGDERLLERIFHEHSVEVVLHTAAYKHVPLMEQNPLAAVVNNALGTYRLVTAACAAGVGQLTMVSTDKAVNPCSIMGASKRIAELAVLSHSTERARMNAVRLGNVLGSSGSVVQIFREQLERGLPLTVTSPDVTRYFVTAAEAESAILRAAATSVSGKILIADCGDARRVVDLARYMAAKFDSTIPAQMEYMGARPGDKPSEELVSEDEIASIEPGSGMRSVDGLPVSKSAVADVIEKLAFAISRHDLNGLLETIEELVPSYNPSPQLHREASSAEMS